MLSVTAALHYDGSRLRRAEVDERHRSPRIGQLRDERRDILRHAGTLAIRIEVPKAGVQQPAFAAWQKRAPHQLHHCLSRRGIGVEHVVGQAFVGRGCIAANGAQPLLHHGQIAFERLLGIRRVLALEKIDPAASGDAIVGAASTYNPFRPGWREGGPNTASGERYDPSVWAAAIKTSLRQKFGGVQFGARPKFALVEAVGKKVIVKINDVGPLTPGRIIDLNERAMRYFDPSLQLGVIYSVIVRPLSGDYWIPGPAG